MAMDLATLKADLDITNDSKDGVLGEQLDAALDFVRDKRPDIDWDGESSSELPGPTATQQLGVIRLAGRWYTRRRTPDGTVMQADLGAGRVPSVDPDIERMLGLGRYHAPVIA